MFNIKRCNASRSSRAHRAAHLRAAIESLESRRLLTSIVVTSAADDGGSGELRAAVIAANAAAKAGTSDTITFNLGVQTITLKQGILELGLNGTGAGVITIDGGNQITISAAGQNGDFQIDAGEHAVFTNIAISHGTAFEGGGVSNSGVLTISNSSIYANVANGTNGMTGGPGSNTQGLGGGIYNNGTLILTNSTVSDNEAVGGGQDAGVGGGLYSTGTATITSSTFYFNAAVGTTVNQGGGGGIYSGGTLSIIGSTLLQNMAYYGGGIYSFSSATVSTCDFESNSADFGAGFYDYRSNATIDSTKFFKNTGAGSGGGGGVQDFEGTMTVDNSTFSYNTATAGGGVFDDQGTLTLQNSTLYHNSATGNGGGGGINNGGSMTVANVTVSGNISQEDGGGINTEEGTLTMVNTIVAGNLSYGNGTDVAGAVQAASSFNLIGDGTSLTGITNGSQGNQVGTHGVPIDPHLAPLAYYGGTLPTMALLAGSTAINAGGAITTLSSAISATATTVPVGLASTIGVTPGGYIIQIDNEQMKVTNVLGNNLTVTRGFNGTTAATHASGAAVNLPTGENGSARTGAVDIGAYEATSTTFAPLVVTTASDAFTHTGLSLRDAIGRAAVDAAHGTFDTITFSSALNGQTITLLQGPLELAAVGTETGTVTINGASQIAVDGNSASIVMIVDSGAKAALSGLTIMHGSAVTGGGIVNDGTLTLANCTVSNNTSIGGNDGDGDNFGGVGAGIDNGGTLTVTNSIFNSNTTTSLGAASGNGAAIANDGTMTVSGSNFIFNSSGDGGAVSNYGTATISTSTFSSNTASDNGGAVDNSGTLTVNNCTFTSNTATTDGGAIYNAVQLTVNGSTFTSNTGFDGGGIANAFGGVLTVSNSTFAQDSAAPDDDGAGGGVFSNDAFTITGSTFVGDSATFGGAVSTNSDANDGNIESIINCTFTQNTAADGGAAFVGHGLAIVHSTISGNTAVNGHGGGIFVNGGDLTLEDTIVAQNTSTGGDAPDIDGAVNSSSNFNFIGINTLLTGISNGSQGNQIGTTTALNPHLAPLDNYGGTTQTMALLANSTAISAGNAISTLTNDPFSGSTVIVVGNVPAFADSPGGTVIRIDNEQMLVTNYIGSDLIVTRGYNGTAIAEHAAGTQIYLAIDQTGQARDSKPDIGAYEYQPPTSTVSALPANQTPGTFTVSWSGHAGSDKAALANYTVYVSDNGGAYTVFQNKTTATSATFTGAGGNTYRFYSVATDLLGNVQPTPSAAQATTTVGSGIVFQDHFDFGTATSPVAAGYTGVNDKTIFSTSLGYGWLSATAGASRDRGAVSGTNALTQDFYQTDSSGSTFKVDLPNGTYNVTVTMGDATFAHDNQGIFLQGAQVDSINTKVDQFVSKTYTTTVTGSVLTLLLKDLGGTDVNTVINGLDIVPVTAHFDFGTPTSPVATGYTGVSEKTIFNTGLGYGWLAAPSGGSRDRGAITGTTALTQDLNQIGSGGSTFEVNLPNGNYKVTVTIGDASFAHDDQGIFLQGTQVDSVNTSIDQFVVKSYYATVVNNQLTLMLKDLGGSDANTVINGLDIVPAAAVPLHYDFGTATSPVASGYTGVSEATLFSAGNGYGWLVAPSGGSRDRGAISGTTALTQDLNQIGSGGSTFDVKLANGTYKVTVTMGDASFAHDDQGVFLQGTQVDSINTAIDQFASKTYTTTVTGGVLTLMLKDLGGTDANTVINGLDIMPA